MDKILSYLKSALIFMPIGVLCVFIASFMPRDLFGGIYMGLASFGAGIFVYYWLLLIINVYRKLKDKESE